MERIAVAMNGETLAASFYEADHVVVYGRSGTWGKSEEIVMPEFDITAPKVLRAQVAIAAERISACGCQIIAGADISGIAFASLDRAGFKIFTIAELTEDTLNSILSDIEADVPAAVNTAPRALGCVGEYELDLVQLQMEHPEISSKMALKSWLTETPFTMLRLRCRHVPPWIIAQGFKITETPDSENVIAEVRPK